MAAPFRRTTIKTFPHVGEKITRDTLYWKNFEFPVTRKEYGQVSSVSFSPVQPHDFVITNSNKIQILSRQSNEVTKSFTRSRSNTHGASFRNDGKLMVAGSEDGHVRLFDISGKALLRVFKGHTGTVHVTRFTNDNLHVWSGGNDRSVRLWDIATEAELTSITEHQDYIRCGVSSPTAGHMLLTGSYDHTVKLFDTRTSASVMTVEHGHPVESVLMYPTGGVFVSAGGSVVKIWDALSGGKLLASFSHHHKTITSLALASNNQRLLSAGLDRLVKVYDVGTYQVVHTLDYPSPILSMDISADDNTLVVGMSDGLLSIQHRKPSDADAVKLKEKQKQKKASYRYTLQAGMHQPQQDDVVIQHKRKEQLAKYDRYFKRFEHSKALDAAMDMRVRTRTPEVVVSVIQELVRRGGIRAALAGRDEKSLSIILKFLQKNISNPKFMSTLVDVATIVLDLYYNEIGQSTALDEMLQRLKQTVDQEVGYMKLLLEVMGTMDTLFCATQQSDISPAAGIAGLATDATILTPSSSAQTDIPAPS